MIDESLDCSPPSLQTKQLNKILDICIEGSSLAGFVFSLLQLFTLGASSSSFFYVLFVSSVFSYHTLSIVKSVFPRFTVEAGFKEKLFLCGDVHYLTIAALFLLTGICPLLYIISYLIIFGVKGISFVIKTLIPMLNNPSLSENPAIDQIEMLISQPIITLVASFCEILLVIQLLFIALFDFRPLTWICLITYALWQLAFLFSTNDGHSRAWTIMATSLRELAAKNSETYGPQLDSVLDKIGDFGKTTTQWYPSHDLKIHLQ
ncbi:hypothetical protein TRFO_41645 [Tritrichomonas foetus]|uniref:Transmembrane protein n=1 Tax=Tritrichomonas foetus TaxID=1144522 RepID=A0A1J4L3Y4_9EUKA|nr:hypothetical protein TRFO_41645 [Tritrichomonas foetus]|eukprot:OHT16684.1 hypothetical protein TRFO_41645 [Tritrichomonas foetus]